MKAQRMLFLLPPGEGADRRMRERRRMRGKSSPSSGAARHFLPVGEGITGAMHGRAYFSRPCLLHDHGAWKVVLGVPQAEPEA
jgi:hypothetical protein